MVQGNGCLNIRGFGDGIRDAVLSCLYYLGVMNEVPQSCLSADNAEDNSFSQQISDVKRKILARLRRSSDRGQSHSTKYFSSLVRDIQSKRICSLIGEGRCVFCFGVVRSK